ncbi:MAG TPA: nucleotidyltransferase domain-containing protein [Candidatus Polarisedimenticolia bacterium]|nr:nucleotidyltransferase domain-containing protein [Candidatus Polarisedimenticolia bacterium]
MNRAQAMQIPVVKRMVEGLSEALGTRLHSVVLYGSAARGDFQEAHSDFNMLVVLEDLEPPTLETLTPLVERWRAKGQHAPRLFTTALIQESADVFPIEFLDIRAGRVVLHGDDPFARLEVRGAYLRLQCERELREKLMRLREGYVECHARRRDLEWLLTDSYTSFVALFRGCLRLLGGEPPGSNADVVAAFCDRARLDPAPFEQVERLRRGETPQADPKSIFLRYHEQLSKAVRTVDRFHQPEGGGTR